MFGIFVGPIKLFRRYLKLYFPGVQGKEENQLEGSLCQYGQTDQSSAEGRDQGIISGVQWIIEGLFDN